MKWVKKLWFPVAATLLVGVIGYNLYTVARLRQSNDAGNVNVASEGSGTRGSSTRSSAVESKNSFSGTLVSTPGPQDIVLRVKTQNADIDAEKLIGALETLSPVEKAVLDGTSVKLTISGPLNLSELVGRLGVQEVNVVEDELPLSGGLRLHASGMT